ncbi:hypothetical protein Emed_007030 [Eimeria media]
MPVRGAISGARDCHFQDTGEKSCFEQGRYYNLDKASSEDCSEYAGPSAQSSMHPQPDILLMLRLQLADAQTAEECYSKCMKEANCKFWSLKEETCYLFKQQTEPSFTFDPRSTSGPRSCSGEELPKAGSGSIAEGISLAETFAYSSTGCMQKCAQFPQCNSFSFVHGNYPVNCTLYNATKISRKAKDKAMITRALMPSSFVSSQCTFSDQLGSSVTVTSPLECHGECMVSELCRAWQTKILPQPQDATAEASSGTLFTCTFFGSADNPTAVRDPTARCGTVVLPGSLKVGKKPSIDAFDEITDGSAGSQTIPECIHECVAQDKCVAWQMDYEKGCLKYERKSGKEDKMDDDPLSVASTVARPPPQLFFFVAYNVPSKRAGAAAAPRSASSKLLSSFRKRLMTQNAGSISRPANSVNDCIDICSEDPTCTAWTFKNNACITFSTAAIPTKDADAISGRRSTPKQQCESDCVVSRMTGVTCGVTLLSVVHHGLYMLSC